MKSFLKDKAVKKSHKLKLCFFPPHTIEIFEKEEKKLVVTVNKDAKVECFEHSDLESELNKTNCLPLTILKFLDIEISI